MNPAPLFSGRLACLGPFIHPDRNRGDSHLVCSTTLFHHMACMGNIRLVSTRQPIRPHQTVSFSLTSRPTGLPATLGHKDLPGTTVR